MALKAVYLRFLICRERYVGQIEVADVSLRGAEFSVVGENGERALIDKHAQSCLVPIKAERHRYILIFEGFSFPFRDLNRNCQIKK